jgi:alpha-D-ribose 1-methylphosphonate 5-triphosphate synthase subunit PhnH
MSLGAGFLDPVTEAQGCFRTLLGAMSRPGRVHRLAARLDEAPPALGAVAGALLLTLADADTPVWMDADAAPAADWLRFHAGCPMVGSPYRAAFAFAFGPTAPALDCLHCGTDEAPQDGATLLLRVSTLEEGRGWWLSGPGIETTHRLEVRGLPPDFLAQWAANRARFPRGVDVILCGEGVLAALPRSVRIDAERPREFT